MLRPYRFRGLWNFAFRTSCCCSSSPKNGGQGGKSNVDISKVVEFFEQAEERIATDATNNVSEKLCLHISDEKAAPESPTDPRFYAKEIIFTAKKGDNEASSKRRQSTAVRLVPWTSNRFLKGYKPVKPAPQRDRVFATMLRECTFVQLGDFHLREVVGVVVENVNDSDLYVDFGGKFLAVVSQPENTFYPRGSLIRVRLRDPEMANRFMINTRAISLLEADVTLLGPYRGQLSVAEHSSTQRGNRDSVSTDHWKLP